MLLTLRDHATPLARKRGSTRLARLSILPALLCATSANAASWQAQEREARKACLSGNYEKGVSILSDLFVDTKDANYIFNQARCFEQNRRYEDAIARFQEYLRAGTNLDAADRAAAEKHIADCQELLPKQPVQPAATPVAAPDAQVAGPTVPPASAPPVVLATPAPAPVPPPGGGALRAAGIVVASVGVAGLITGLVMNLKVNSMASELEELGAYSDGRESDRKTYASIGWVGYGVGAGCVATGAVLYYLGWRRGAATSSAVALAPSLAPGRVGIAVEGAF